MSEDEVYLPPEAVTSRLEVRDPVTQGRRAWGYISEDGLLIMSDAGDVWVRHGPEEVLGSTSAAREFAHEQKFRPPPEMLPGSPYDRAPHAEHCCRVVASKPPHHSLVSRLSRWLLASRAGRVFE